MRIGKICRTIALLLVSGIAGLGGAIAGTNPKTAIFVDNSSYVTAYPLDSNGDVSPIALTTEMINPGGIARDSSGRIYVTNTPTNTVTVYQLNATGNVAPLAVIGGAKTRLASPTAIALDGSGNIYVLNTGTSSIAIFAPLGGSSGIIDQAQAATIRGPKTRLDAPIAIAVDSSGKIYVANQSGGARHPIRRFAPGVITIYSAGSVGDVAPAAIIAGRDTGLTDPVGIAVDAGGAIYVGNEERYVSPKIYDAASIEVFAAGSSGDARPTAVIAGNNTGLDFPQGIAVDSQENIYATGYFIDSKGNYTYAINAYPSGSSGNVFPATVIGGADTGLSYDATIALDGDANIYVANEFGGPSGTGNITVYASGSSGDSTPTTTIISHFNGIDQSSGIAVDSSGKIYVPNGASNSVAIYAAGSYGVRPPVDIIVGADTGLFAPFVIGLDASGNIAVLNGNGTLTEYPAGSAGDSSPSVSLDVGNDGLTYAVAMAVERRGAIYVASQRGENCDARGCFPTGTDHVAIYRPGSAGDAKPAAVISGPNTGPSSPSGVALDAAGNVYVTNGNCAETGFVGRDTRQIDEGLCSGSGSITIYASGTNGDVKPVAAIAGANTALSSPSAITIDGNGNIYVLNTVEGVGSARITLVPGVWYLPGFLSNGPPPRGNPFGLPSILIFKVGSDGDVAPTAIIGGPFTALGGSGIAIGPTAP